MRWFAGLLTLAVLALILAAYGVAGAYQNGSADGGPPAPGAEDEDAGALRRLAERALSNPGPYGAVVRAELLPGRLPDELPLDLPLPDGGDLIGSVILRAEEGPYALTVEFDAPGSTEDVLAFYEDALPPLGWEAPDIEYGGSVGGFQSGYLGGLGGARGTFCRDEKGPYLTIAALPRDDGTAAVRVSVVTGKLGSGGYGPCEEPAPHTLPPGAGTIPPLTPPDGVRLDGMGAGGGSGRWSSQAVAFTDMSAADLEAHFAGQLADGGWKRLDGGADGPVAWSTWEVPRDEGDPWEGLLLVLESAGGDRRTLLVQAQSAESPFAAGGWADLVLVGELGP